MLGLMVLIALAGGCARLADVGAPVESAPTDPLAAAFEQRHELALASVRSAPATPFTGGPIEPVAAPEPDETERSYETPWRQASQVLYLGGTPGPKQKRFVFSTLQAVQTRIFLRSVAATTLDVSGECDGTVILGTMPLRPLQPHTPFRFRMEDRSAGISVPLDLGSDTERCDLALTGASGFSDRITLLRQDVRSGPFAGIDARYDVCATPEPAGQSALERVFRSDRFLSQTCILPARGIRPLADARDGFNAKVRALLGRELPDAFFDAGNPRAPIDFSDAPALKLIYASYLDIKADFSGVVFLRLLRHHAARGVPIRIVITEILMRPKDRRPLERLAADHPNVQIQEFAWPVPPFPSLEDRIDHLHRTHHIKLLAVLAQDPRQSRAILGGRNVHDGFVFERPLDLSRFPDLHDYRKKNGLSLDYFSNFEDLDVEVSGHDAVRTLAAHFSTIWHRDQRTGLSTPYSVTRRGGQPREGYRHFISVPYADGGALERYYVELIDAAADSIEMINPYLNPTPAIEDALERALARGVRIEIITRINLLGDLGGSILTRLNELFVEKFAGRITIREYRGRSVILHAKLMLIDGILSLISSVNLNHRSFLHDSENGIVLYSREEYRHLRRVYDMFGASSVPVSEEVDIPYRYRLLLGIDLLREAM